MKKFLLLHLLLSFAVLAVAQDSVRIITTTAPALYKPQERIFYKRISNPFTVKVNNIAPDSLIVTTDKGLLQGTKGDYSVSFPGDTTAVEERVNIYLATRDTTGTAIRFDSLTFSLRPIPMPEAMIAGRTSGKTTRETVAGADSIIVILRNCHLRERCSVLSFNLTFYKEGLFYEFKQEAGNRMTERQKSAILHTEPNTLLNFERIKVKCPDGVIRFIAPVKIEVSD